MPVRLFRRSLLPATLWALLALACALPAAAVEVVKSPGDTREFEYLQLNNGMKVLLVSDPEADKAAAALSVGVGSAGDPPERQGLAHFLEHMLFLGTAKYPKPGEYDEFMHAHGGTENAYTAFENTNYHFSIDKDYLEGGVDRFAQFFVAPLFTADYVQREKNAVNSEYKARIKDDDRRLYSALQQVVNPRHPFSKFAVGSLETLSDRDGSGIRDELMDFYRRHYSADLMTLAVLGKEPLPRLEEWVRSRFDKIENRSVTRPAIDAPLFEPGRLPLRLDVEPLREERQLQLYFPIPPVAPYYRQKPIDYIANLLGHEGAGSLLSSLKARGWADQLGAGLGRDDSDGAAVSLSIRLSEEGLAHVKDIVGLVFQTLRLIERDGVEQWRYAEQARLAQIAFQFDQKDSALHSVIDLAEMLDRVAPEDVVQAHFQMVDFDEALIRRYLAYLRPENMLMVVTAKGMKTDRRDPWYDTAYAVRPIGGATLGRWAAADIDAGLALPAPNPFIPENTELKTADADATAIPARIDQQPGYELWFKQDEAFKQPRADFYFSVRTPAANDSAEHAVLTSLYTQLVSDELNEFSYAAQLAGLSYSLYPHIRGFTVRISGYEDKLALLLTRIVEALRNPTLTREALERERQVLIRGLENVRHDNPYEQILSEIAKLIVHPSWTEEKRLAAAHRVRLEDLRAFVSRLLRDVQVVALAHGNLRRADARALGDIVRTALVEPATPVEVPPGQVVQLDSGTVYRRELGISHPDSAVVAYFQGKDRSAAERARFELLAQILEAPFYNDLRTEKQLGYVVSAGSLPLLDVPGITFLIQSPTTHPADLEANISQFLASYRGAVAAMPAELFESHREGLLSRILTREERLQMRTDRYWSDLDLQRYRFDGRQQLADAVRAITLEDFRKFYEQVLLDAGRRELVVQSTGSAHEPVVSTHEPRAGVIISDPDGFAEGHALVPGSESMPLSGTTLPPGAHSPP
ncbi:MAG: Protease 3 [Gammaproteobacteria bacterium]|nr:Protease 3 [Gammaproteobacteria bacterium]